MSLLKKTASILIALLVTSGCASSMESGGRWQPTAAGGSASGIVVRDDSRRDIMVFTPPLESSPRARSASRGGFRPGVLSRVSSRPGAGL